MPGLDPRWSRLVEISDLDGRRRTFHVLDSHAAGAVPADEVSAGAPSGDAGPAGAWSDGALPDGALPAGTVPPTVGTVLCVHGNPTWSYLWRRLLAAAPPGWRVVAPDQLGMGFSERIGTPRTLAQRVDDLCRLTDALGISPDTPVVTVAHDWGGIISLGWALRHRSQLRGVVLTNTAVHQPDGDRGPALIRLAHLPGVNQLACTLTPLFVRATTSLTWPRLPSPVRNAFAAPYRTVARRRPVGEFVADIPFAAGHPSHPDVSAIAEGVTGFDVPALLLWGPRDPVFSDVYLRDLQRRLPHAALHRYEKASHLLPEDAPGYAGVIADWVAGLGEHPAVSVGEQPSVRAGEQPSVRVGDEQLVRVGEQPSVRAGQRPSVLGALAARSGDDAVAVSEMGGRSITWRELSSRVDDVSAGLTAAGVRPGDRIALLVPPSIELTVALYAVWRAGGVIVVADRGLGVRGMGRALRGAKLDHLVADTAGLLASRWMRLPGRRFAVQDRSAAIRRLGLVDRTFDELAAVGNGRSTAPDAGPDDEAAVLFTSGATGPAKGVLYRHRQVRAQLELIGSTYGLTADDRIVAAFAPFALYGPALGLRSVVPETDVTKPGRLTAVALADAAATIGATVVFASPAALRNVVRTSGELSGPQRDALGGVRLLMSAGASVPVPLLRQVQLLLPAAELHTPYGMTEALPLTDVSLAQIEEAGEGDGVCVGWPLAGVELAVAPLDASGVPGGELTGKSFVTGEIWARGDHVRDRYDASYAVDAAAAGHPGRHRTGDVGFLDDAGRLWIQGRLVHVITAPAGPVTPVGIEVRVEARLSDALDVVGSFGGAAAVGVGPAGTQQVVVVLSGRGGPLAPATVSRLVREAAGVDVAAVLIARELPVDIRHNSKIDRAAVARWATRVSAGG